MFLKSLELNGFKSFAQKTVLEFPSGITAVVGPNGSGKSNIIDAIRWLLGEREAKNLRGAKAEDLIFNGTPKRAKVGMAAAGLNFDNGSGFFPVDFKDVSINRRVSRDGTSQYFLNKSEVRLKDIIDFFSRSRLGTKGLSIINQGNSDLFVRVSPEERRIMIEEVLGLREYQLKKSEAQRKLKTTFSNLEKAKAMIDEVLPRLRLLKRQTAKLEQRTELENELRKMENGYFSSKFREIEKNRAEFEPLLASLDAEKKKRKKELDVLESNLQKINSFSNERKEFKTVKNLRNDLLNRKSEIQKELGRLEAKLEFLNVADKSFEADKGELLVLIAEIRKALDEIAGFDADELRKKTGELIFKIDAILKKPDGSKNKEASELSKSKTVLTEEFKDIEGKLEKLENEEFAIALEMEKFNERFRKAYESVEFKKEEIRGIDGRINKILFEKEKLELKFQDLKDQLIQIGRSENEFRSFGAHSGAVDADDAEIERKMFKFRTELAAIGEIDENLIKEAKEVEEHYNFLTGQSKDLEKAAVDLKILIKELEEKIHFEFNDSLKLINGEFGNFFSLMFGGGYAKLKLKFQNEELRAENGEENRKDGEEEAGGELKSGVEIELSLAKKRVSGLDMLSGGEKTLVSIAALFAMISVSPPPFLVLDEIDAALDENNSRRFSNLVKKFSQKTQFIIVTHNRATMEAADVLYGVTVAEDGTSKILSLKLGS